MDDVESLLYFLNYFAGTTDCSNNHEAPLEMLIQRYSMLTDFFPSQLGRVMIHKAWDWFVVFASDIFDHLSDFLSIQTFLLRMKKTKGFGISVVVSNH